MTLPLEQPITIQKRANKPSLRAKINAKCSECIYDPYAEGSWRKQVENCTSYKCPLFKVRPTSIKRNT